MNGERGVTQPGESIVPIQIAADAFRQRSCRRGNDRARRRVRKQFERERAAKDLAFIRTAIIRVTHPFLPPIDREIQSLANGAPERR